MDYLAYVIDTGASEVKLEDISMIKGVSRCLSKKVTSVTTR